VDPCTVYALSKDDFEDLLRASHGFTRRLLQAVSVRLRATNNQIVREVARCRDTAKSEIQKLERLVEASMHLNSTLNLEEVLDRILDTALHIVDGDRGTVYLVEEKRQELWSRVLTGADRFEIRLPLGKGIAGYVAATGDTLNIPDAYVDPRFNPDVDRRSGYRTRTILCMPMRNHAGKVIGVFQLLNKHEGLFTREDELRIDALSVHAAIAVENARLYESEREMLKLEKKLVAAREVQRMLLPQELPSVPGLELSASTTPAEEVGGDLYDFISFDDGSLALWTPGVAPHGKHAGHGPRAGADFVDPRRMSPPHEPAALPQHDVRQVCHGVVRRDRARNRRFHVHQRGSGPAAHGACRRDGGEPGRRRDHAGNRR
jgi:putative methionine-R-sulfoxide reductase with GAF domain